MTSQFVEIKITLQSRLSVVFILFCLLTNISCGQFSTPSKGNPYARTEVAAIETVFWAVNSGLMMTEGNFLNSSCTTEAPQMQCSGPTDGNCKATYEWDNCSFDSGRISIINTSNNHWTSLYLSETLPQCKHPPALGKEVSRVFDGGASDPPLVYHMPNSDFLEVNTNQYPQFPGQPMKHWGIHTRQVSVSPNQRQMRIDTVQMVRKKSDGSVLYNVFLHTNEDSSVFDISSTGTLATSNRVVTGFTYAYFEGVQRVKVTFNNVQWSDATCCYPKSGYLSLLFDDFAPPTSWTPNAKTARLDFTSTCGAATLTAVDGRTSSYNMPGCF